MDNWHWGKGGWAAWADHLVSAPLAIVARAHTYTSSLLALAVDDYDAQAAAEKKRARSFRKFSYRGVELDQLLDMSNVSWRGRTLLESNQLTHPSLVARTRRRSS